MDKYITEFIGTFFLVVAIGLAVIPPGAGTLAPLAIGLTLIALVYAGGHISGAHYNPAVTLAMWMRGKCPATDITGYIVAQLVGAVLGAMTVKYLTAFTTVTAMSLEIGPAFVAEVLFTFLLVWVILNVAIAEANAGNSFYGIAIGLTVAGGAWAVGGISGAVFNPAVAVAVITMGGIDITDFWIYLVANVAGGALAAVVYGASMGTRFSSTTTG